MSRALSSHADPGRADARSPRECTRERGTRHERVDRQGRGEAEEAGRVMEVVPEGSYQGDLPGET